VDSLEVDTPEADSPEEDLEVEAEEVSVAAEEDTLVAVVETEMVTDSKRRRNHHKMTPNLVLT